MINQPDDVLSTLAGMIREVIGESWAEELAIGRDTSFNRDLELESIEFVSLAEKMQLQYEGRVDFANWLADKDLDQIIGLTVGEVVDYIHSCLTSIEAA